VTHLELLLLLLVMLRVLDANITCESHGVRSKTMSITWCHNTLDMLIGFSAQILCSYNVSAVTTLQGSEQASGRVLHTL
jgi:hypothetical protein